MITIILADDHPVVRQGLAALLQSQADFQIVGQAGDGIETMDLVERLRPQALVLDLMMPGLNGLEVTRRVRQRSPGTRIVMLSMHADESYVLRRSTKPSPGVASSVRLWPIASRRVTFMKRAKSPLIRTIL